MSQLKVCHIKMLISLKKKFDKMYKQKLPNTSYLYSLVCNYVIFHNLSTFKLYYITIYALLTSYTVHYEYIVWTV